MRELLDEDAVEHDAAVGGIQGSHKATRVCLKLQFCSLSEHLGGGTSTHFGTPRAGSANPWAKPKKQPGFLSARAANPRCIETHCGHNLGSLGSDTDQAGKRRDSSVVEQLICNHQVVGSNPTLGSTHETVG